MHGAASQPVPHPLADETARYLAQLSEEYIFATEARREEIGALFVEVMDGTVVPMVTR